MKMHVKKNDKVIVISGEDKGTIANVVTAFPKEGKVVVKGVNMVKKHLKPGGAVAINMNMFSESDSGKTINDWLCGTVTNVFDSVYSVHASSNLELFCSDSYDVHEQLEAKLGTIEDNELYHFMRDISDSLEKVEKTDLILTDDKAPVELLSMRVLDEMINEELEYLKGSIKGKGIKELYEMLVSGEF